MKKVFNLVITAIFGLSCLGTLSCSDEDFTETIFDTREYPLDKTSYTFPLDTFVKKNFLEKYNMRFIYKMQDIGSDLQKNLVPCSYDKSCELAVLAKYLWYDVYEKCAGQEFLRKYSPRIIHVIGSPSYNPASGTETLGYAEGGLKISLMNANHMSIYNIEDLNEKFFKTMHHEFSHILHQTIEYPQDFRLISRSLYNPISWQETADSIAISQGFVSDYASSADREDWVETIANYIVKDSISWNNMLNSAEYDWERVSVSKKLWDTYNILVRTGRADRDSVGYIDRKNPDASSGSDGQYNIQRKLIQRDANDYAEVDANGKIIYLKTSGINGREIILRKLEMTRQWLLDNFNVKLDDLRREVQQRQWETNPDGTFKFDENGQFINRLITTSEDGRIFMEKLLDEVNQYKSLQ
jgi:substrate import-associated zinc metallohydrolase lipoprotein